MDIEVTSYGGGSSYAVQQFKGSCKKKRLEVQSKKKGPDEKKTSTQIPGCIKVQVGLIKKGERISTIIERKQII